MPKGGDHGLWKWVCGCGCHFRFGGGQWASAQASHTDSDATHLAYASAEVEIPKEMSARYDHAKWKYPETVQAANFNPNWTKLRKEQDGVTILCHITQEGRLTGCEVIADTNPKFGFGPATVALFEATCHVDPETVDGGIQAGDIRKFTLNWMLG